MLSGWKFRAGSGLQLSSMKAGYETTDVPDCRESVRDKDCPWIAQANRASIQEFVMK